MAEDPDGLILLAALDTQSRCRSRSGSGEGEGKGREEVVLWTGDTNLQARAELRGLRTISFSGSRHFSSSSSSEAGVGRFLALLGVSLPSEEKGFHPTSARPLPVGRKASSQAEVDHLLPVEAMALILQTYFPPAVIRRVGLFRSANPRAFERTGIPQEFGEMGFDLAVRPPPSLPYFLALMELTALTFNLTFLLLKRLVFK